jgi:hypothetical protein
VVKLAKVTFIKRWRVPSPVMPGILLWDEFLGEKHCCVESWWIGVLLSTHIFITQKGQCMSIPMMLNLWLPFEDKVKGKHHHQAAADPPRKRFHNAGPVLALMERLSSGVASPALVERIPCYWVHAELWSLIPKAQALVQMGSLGRRLLTSIGSSGSVSAVVNTCTSHRMDTWISTPR